MKKLLAILMCVSLLGICSSATAATVLSDRELGELYAGLPFINKPVAEQTNIAVVTAIGGRRDGDIVFANIDQENKASVPGLIMAQLIATAIGPQKNIAAMYASDGDIAGVRIDQDNKARVSGAVIATGFWFFPGIATAVSEQKNIATIVAGEKGRGDDGNISFALIDQKNKAKVCGIVIGDSTATAIESQTNIAALYAGDDIHGVGISQKNRAKVNGSVIAPMTVTKIGPQMNIATLYAKGDIIGTCVRQSNSARIGGSFGMGGL